MELTEAIAVFDKSAKHTRPNAQTEAWGVIRAALTPPPDAAVGAQGDGWQSMDTAPRDGTVISLRWGDDGDAIGWWMKHKAFREGSCYSWAFIDTNNGQPFVNSAVDNEYGPTHWRPCRLAAPAAGKGVGDGRLAAAVMWAREEWADKEHVARCRGDTGLADYYGRCKDSMDRALTEAALTRQPVAGDGMVSLDAVATNGCKVSTEIHRVPYKYFASPASLTHPKATPTDGGEGKA